MSEKAGIQLAGKAMTGGNRGWTEDRAASGRVKECAGGVSPSGATTREQRMDGGPWMERIDPYDILARVAQSGAVAHP